MADGDTVFVGRQNTSSSETRFTRSGTTPNVSSLVVANDNGNCVVGNAISAWPGVVGTSESGNGILGTSTAGNGVRGISSQGSGVSGRCEDPLGTGVFGNALGPGKGTGVRGNAAGDGTGVIGYADGVGNGVFGEAAGGGTGVVGSAPSPGWAGVFWGNVYISGDLTTQGAKSAVLRHSDGSLRRVYALESPESWFEDLGRAQIVDGRAEVELDNEFSAMVQTDDYHVFLTPEGDTRGLHVSARTPGRFEVREQQGGTSNLMFSYRVVARRSDIEAERLQQIEAPAALADALPSEYPEPPELRY